MKTASEKSRRGFLGTLALGAAAGTVSMFANPLYANMSTFDESQMDDVEKWFKKIKGKHRVVFDGSTPNEGFPVIWNWAFYLTNNGTGATDDQITAMTVFRHTAAGFAYEDRIWKKYKLGEFFGINDNNTGKPALRNPYYEPKGKDFPIKGVDGIKRMQERGALFCICDLATKVYSGFVAENMGMDPQVAYEDWKSGILPDIKLVPAGIWALERAQKHQCSYIFAG
ncbi:twin-arginine translocation signal domain-containing protein [Flagellimonas allohymeniacidonis]|uniref:Twin-arginine translocation signal domain-containing protein n=1 Tax=Flagellimonas allohymeniacidonis TaxID=2517819 RepID=A0A4Q8QGB1_9FLAO|nr:twin-arginine translocation signal domain-containing protein [Allomuricauda hymeniacidonis]TAI49575.1 twin-arginine translocation signal domain-containing protein [Allomuricauda hymeniacidonis]